MAIIKGQYLVRTEVAEVLDNRFYNIKPLLRILKNGEMESVNPNDFGSYGTIQIKTGKFQITATKYPFMVDGTYYVVSLSDDLIETNQENITYNEDSGQKITMKINLIALDGSYRNIIKCPIYEIINLPETYSTENPLEWEQPMPLDIIQPITKKVYLSDSKCMIGPFDYQVDEDGLYTFYPHSNKVNKEYMLDCYELTDIKNLIHDFNAEKYSYAYGIGRTKMLINYQHLSSQPHHEKDCISDEKLCKEIGNWISSRDKNLTRVEKKKTEQKIHSMLNANVLSAERTKRVKKMVKDGIQNNDFIEQLANLVLSESETWDKVKDEIADDCFSDPNKMKRLYSIIQTKEGFKKRIEALDTEENRQQEKLQKLQLQVDEQENILKSKNELVRKLSLVNDKDTQKKIKEKDDTIEKLQLSLKKYDELKGLDIEAESLKKQCSDAENKLKIAKEEYHVFSREKDMLATEVKNQLQSSYSSLSINKELAHIIVEEAANFEKSRKIQKNNNINIVTNCNYQTSDILSPKELIEFLYKEISEKGHRTQYSKNDIANLIICMSLNFLTVLVGEPGTGKTSLVNLIANILGFTNQDNPRYTEIAVEKGWTSRRDLIGYYNPLTKEFDAASGGMYKALLSLNNEACNQNMQYPYLILLDEANLSKMEYYWADFMSLCDFDKKGRVISLAGDHFLEIPKTLRFITTMNLDHTTEVLSPRLIDRAWIIKLESSPICLNSYEEAHIDENYPLVKYDPFNKIYDLSYSGNDTLDSDVIEKFSSIENLFHSQGINFGARTIRDIQSYCLAGANIMDLSNNIYGALDYAVSEKVLPTINGYGTEYREFMQNFLNECPNSIMPKCHNLIEEILSSAPAKMQYYQYFAR